MPDSKNEAPSYTDSIAETTPSHLVNRDQNISAAAKRRVNNATDRPGLTMRRCLIENTAELNQVEYVHCLPRNTKSLVLDRLEFAWKMEWSTLNVNTRYNILRLSPKFHKAFDAGKWLLLPETSIINKYYDASDTGEVPNINHEMYKYKLISSPRMREIPIHRLNIAQPQPPLQPSATDFSYFPHPYHEFPIINSHVHPRFVICNSGLKLQGLLTWIKAYGDLRDDIIKVRDIWLSWTKKIPRGISIPTKLMDDDDSSIEDDDSHKTAPRYVYRSTWSKRKTREEQSSPTLMSSKRQRLAKDGPWLDDEALHKFDQRTMANNKCADMKKQLIMDWLSGVSPLETKAGVNQELNGVTDLDGP